MKHKRMIDVSVFSIFLTLSACRSSLAEHNGAFYSFSIQLFELLGISLFGTDEQFSLKDVHLDGSALLNREVMVAGKVEVVGAYGTFVVISEDKVRMLIDLSRLGGSRNAISTGDTMRVIGKVQSGEKGHFYLVANAINRG